MNRRGFFLAMFGAPLVANAQPQRCWPDESNPGFLICTDPTKPTEIKVNPEALVLKVANEFAAEWNTWAALRTDTPPGAFSFAAKKQWTSKVEPAWKEVRVAVRNE